MPKTPIEKLRALADKGLAKPLNDDITRYQLVFHSGEWHLATNENIERAWQEVRNVQAV